MSGTHISTIAMKSFLKIREYELSCNVLTSIHLEDLSAHVFFFVFNVVEVVVISG
jgi:hypothetical protein